jgi:hypothetical protein
MLQIPLPGTPIVDVSCTDKIQGDQDCVFHFRGDLANNEAHSDIS